VNFFLNNPFNLLLLLLAVVSGAALLVPNLLRRGEKVSTLQATQLINQGKTVLVDVRDSALFAQGHLRDARNIPLKELSVRTAELAKFKAKTVLVVCASGTQSARASTVLRNAGFAKVVSLAGGLTAWQSQGLPVAR
jgi:rhodanese-related sulfurtransferase